MKIYLFTSNFEIIKELESTEVDGVLHTYNANDTNAFINIAKNISTDTKIKHMVAIRPYTISPQFLSQITRSFSQMYKENFLQINLVSGWIKENEKKIKGIVGTVNDESTSIERSKYLIDYIDSLEKLNDQSIDYYISVTNQFTFDAAIKNNSKIIIDYTHFKDKRYAIKYEDAMVNLQPADNNGVLFSHEELLKILWDLELSGIKEVIFGNGGDGATEHVIELAKKYKTIDFSVILSEDYGKLDT